MINKTKKSNNVKVFNDVHGGDAQQQTISSNFTIEKNAIVDKGEGKILFSKPISLTDTSEQWNGTKYDVKSMDISGWNLLLTADHYATIQKVLGKVIGLKKVGNQKVTIDGIDFAVKQNPLAEFAYNMMVNGYLTDFSIETFGPWPDDEGIYYNSQLVGCSVVVQGNNKQAHVNQIATSIIERCKKDGLDSSEIENIISLPIDRGDSHQNNDFMKYKIVKNNRSFSITLKYKNSAGEDSEVTLNPNQSVEVPESGNETVETQVADAKDPAVKDQPKSDNNIADVVKNAIADAVKPLQDKIETLEKTTFDNNAQEPQFKKVNTNKVSTELSAMDWRERHANQINAAWEALKDRNPDGAKKLNSINEYHLQKLQESKVVANSMTIADMGNFVISPELLTEIEGFRSDFSGLLSRVPFRDTLSLQMAWLKRNGDISMQEVDMCEDGDDGNLKPISEYDASYNVSSLKEVAAVTPVCDAATRFLAVDLLGDIAQGYRTDYDRKRAQLIIARLQQAVNSSGNVVNYNTGTSGGGANVNALQSFMSVAALQEEIMNGTYILSLASYWELMSRQAAAGINTEAGMRIFTTGDNGPLMFGAPYIIVPNELLPKLGSSQTRAFTVDGASVTIDKAVFYADLQTISARTSGGLKYDMSTEAAYEVNGTVKSAFQRNELVLRGSFFRGAAVRDEDKVVGLNRVNLS